MGRRELDDPGVIAGSDLGHPPPPEPGIEVLGPVDVADGHRHDLKPHIDTAHADLRRRPVLVRCLPVTVGVLTQAFAIKTKDRFRICGRPGGHLGWSPMAQGPAGGGRLVGGAFTAGAGSGRLPANVDTHGVAWRVRVSGRLWWMPTGRPGRGP